MPFDSQGNFTRLHSWEQARIDDIDIVTDHHDAEDDNFADGFNQCFLRSGVVPMKGNLNAGGFKVTRVKEATDDTDAVNLSQVETKVEELKTEITKTINDSLMIGDIKCSALQKDHGNWMICNGRALSREDYADLFEAIGETIGAAWPSAAMTTGAVMTAAASSVLIRQIRCRRIRTGCRGFSLFVPAAAATSAFIMRATRRLRRISRLRATLRDGPAAKRG